MIKPNILNETPITMAELKEELKKIKKRDESLNFRAERTEEYLTHFAILKEKEAKALIKKFEELEIPRFRKEHMIKLVDILPTSADEVNLVLQGYTITVSKENLKRIADVIKEVAKE